MEGKIKINFRKVFIISILVICVIAINLSVYFGITKKDKKAKIEPIVIDTATLTENFTSIFDNRLDYQGNNVSAKKQDKTKDLVYINYTKQEKVDGLYEVNVNIPYVNINSDLAEKINSEINNLFYKKVASVLNTSIKNTVYIVKYKAYINDNILSIIVSSALKEGSNPQREIIKTYNYNLSSNNNLNIMQLLEYRKLSNEYAQSKINETIKIASEKANMYKELGYSKYLRDINSDMYKLENTSVYFLGEGKAIYILYPYGNQNYTSEMDLLVI